MTYLFTRGINDENRVEPFPGKGGQINFKFDGSSSVFSHMRFDSNVAKTVVFFGDKIKQSKIQYQQKPTLVFNEIADPDSHKGALQRCEEFCQELEVPVLNHPAAIRKTTRDSVANLLQGISGLTMPTTVRCAPRSPDELYAVMRRSNLEYPAIVRLAGVHGGESSILIKSNRDREKLHIFPFDGRDFYITQFVDYQDQDGLYRKYRLVIVGQKLLLRHMLISDHWMVHASSRAFTQQHPDLLAERERRSTQFMSEIAPKIGSKIRQIAQRIGLDYFGIDCGIDSHGNMLVFEANANMNILLIQEKSSAERVQAIKDAIVGLLRSREPKA